MSNRQQPMQLNNAGAGNLHNNAGTGIAHDNARVNANQQPRTLLIAPRHWNPLFDGPCTKGFLLDNDIIQYLKTTFLTNNPGIPVDSLYILGVRYHLTFLQSNKPGLETDYTAYDTQLGISETCKIGESPIHCLKRGLLEELHIRLNDSVNPILSIPAIPRQPRSRNKYIFHFTNKTDYILVQEPSVPRPEKDSRNKIITCIVGTLDNLYPILNNFLLVPQLPENDPIVYPVLFPFKKLFLLKNLPRNLSLLPLIQTFKNGLLNINRNFSGLNTYSDMLAKYELLFENPEDFIIPLNSPNFYEIMEKSLRKAQSIKFMNFINNHPNDFIRRIHDFMKLVEFYRLQSFYTKKSITESTNPFNIGMAFQAMGTRAVPNPVNFAPGMGASASSVNFAPGMGASASPVNATSGMGATSVETPSNRNRKSKLRNNRNPIVQTSSLQSQPIQPNQKKSRPPNKP